MNTMTDTMHPHPTRESSLKWVAGGSIMEAAGSIAAIALAIVGLAGVFSLTMAAIATIVIGAGILIESGSFGAAAFRSGEGEAAWESNEGFNAEFLGGLAGIILGVLALLGVASATLVSVAVLVYGASFLLGSLALSRPGFAAGSSGGLVLVGLGAAVLGILAVIGLSTMTLALVGLLSLGAGALFAGSAQSVAAAAEVRAPHTS